MTSREAPPDDGYLAIGEIKGPYGVRGAVWVKPFGAHSSRGPRLADAVLSRDGESAPAKVTSLKVAGEGWIVTLAGIVSREDAEGLRGWSITIPNKDITALPEGTYYVHELIGRTVVAEDGRLLGKIVNVIPTGTNDVYAIDGPEGELLFPALRDLVLDCRHGSDTIQVRIPPGLMESCLTRRS